MMQSIASESLSKVSRTPTPGATGVLVVDDERPVREVLQKWVSREGYQCFSARNGIEALEVLSLKKPSLVISDIAMPGMTGIELLEQAHAEDPDVAFLMVTGSDDRSLATEALEKNAAGYLLKPLDYREFMINVEKVLRHRELNMSWRNHQNNLESTVEARTATIRNREEEMAVRLVWAAESRDLTSAAHIRRIGLFSACLAQAMNWDREQVNDIRIAATMHDIGKIALPDAILLKPGKLTAEEFEVAKRHTVLGAKILAGSRVSMLRMAEKIALCHHERWDGKGYPAQLSGSEVPASARIVSVVDSYDAILEPRVYKPRRTEDEALRILAEERGRQFCPSVVDCFLRILPEIREIREKVESSSPYQNFRDFHQVL